MSKAEDHDATFSVAGADSSFQGRSKDVFESLNIIAAKHSAFEKILSKSKSSDPDFKDKHDVVNDEETVDEDDFKVPSGSAPKGKIVSQHQQIQHKPDNWTHYDLSDVKCAGSDARNSATAFEFIENLKKAKLKNPDDDEAMDLEHSRELRHTFRKPTLKRTLGEAGGSAKKAKKVAGGLEHLIEEEGLGEKEDEEHRDDKTTSEGFRRKGRKKVNIRCKDEDSEEEDEKEEKKEDKEEKKEESSEEDEEDLNDGLT